MSEALSRSDILLQTLTIKENTTGISNSVESLRKLSQIVLTLNKTMAGFGHSVSSLQGTITNVGREQIVSMSNLSNKLADVFSKFTIGFTRIFSINIARLSTAIYESTAQLAGVIKPAQQARIAGWASQKGTEAFNKISVDEDSINSILKNITLTSPDDSITNIYKDLEESRKEILQATSGLLGKSPSGKGVAQTQLWDLIQGMPSNVGIDKKKFHLSTGISEEFVKIGAWFKRFKDIGVKGVWKDSNIVSNGIKNVWDQFKGMTKSMLAMKLITMPMQALLEGILEPLEPLIDLFGAFGSVIGVQLLPIITPLVSIMAQLLPYFGMLVNLLFTSNPLFQGLVNTFTNISKLLSGEIKWDSFTDTIKDLPNKAVSGLLLTIGNIDWSGVWTAMKGLGNKIGQAILEGLAGIGDLIKKFLQQIVTGGGADNNIWTLGD